MSWVMLRSLIRTIVIRLVLITAVTGALGVGLAWLLDVAISERLFLSSVTPALLRPLIS